MGNVFPVFPNQNQSVSTGVEVNRQMLKGVKGCVVKLDNVIVL